MTDSPTFPNAIACQHGALRRVCEICERDDEIKTLTRERDEAITALAESHAAQLRNEKALCARTEIAINERDAWRKLVLEHNARRYWDDSKIAIPPELDQP